MATVARFWRARNLRDNPFFQAALEPSEDARYPIHLFVGRIAEAERILAGMDRSDSRSAVQGAPGVGKTSLVQYVKAKAAEEGIASTEGWVTLGSGAELENVLLQILGEVYFALLGADVREFQEHPSMKAARQLLLAYEIEGGGVSFGIATISGGVSRSSSAHAGPGAVLVHVPHLLRDLAGMALQSQTLRGVLVHLNNLENPTEANAQNAAQVLRDLRDHCLLVPGLHFIVAGTDSAVRQVISGQPQLRGVFGVPEIISPLEPQEVQELLQRRYEYLKVNKDEPVPPFVTDDSLTDLYRLFQGDLRSTLQALEEAAKRLAPLAEHPTDPMDEQALRRVLKNVYQQMVRARLDETALRHVERIAATVGSEPFTRADLAKAIDRTDRQSRAILSDLQVNGIVQSVGQEEAEGPGRPAELFALTGTARLAFAVDASPPETP